MLVKMRSAGFSLIEMMVVVVIIAIVTMAGLPSVAEWLQNSRTRSVAESLQNGIRYAEGEAARLNRLTTITTTSSGWTVTYTKIASGNDTLATTLQSSPRDNLSYVTITPDASAHTALQFNDLGRVFAASSATGTFTALTADATFTVANSKGPRKLSVKVSPSGKVRMCDPDKTFSDTNPGGC
jgi:type IV fimbrial biogenesis protein FimT